MQYIHITQKSAMKSLSSYVSRGFFYYTFGVIKLDKAEQLSNKFHDKYGTQLEQWKFRTLKKNGHARCRLIYFLHQQEIHFWLLSTSGKGKIFQLEKMLDARTNAVPFLNAKLRDKNQKFTWFLDKQFYESMRDECVHAARLKTLDKAKSLIAYLMFYPPFHNIRVQRKKIFDVMRKATKKNLRHMQKKKDNEIKVILEFIPAKQGWTRFSRKEAMPISELLPQN